MDPSEVAELRALVIEAARQVLPGCGIPVAGEFEPKDDAVNTRELVAFMGFAGAVLRGTLAIVAPIDLMRQAYPLPLPENARSEFEVFDWSDEIANRLLARIKNALAARGVEIESSTPRVMLAEQLHIGRSVLGTVCSTCFVSSDSWIKIWFDAVAPAGQKVLSAASENVTPLEGEVVLF